MTLYLFIISVLGLTTGKDRTECSLPTRDPFLERPGKLSGPESDFDIKVSRKVGRVLISDEVLFVSSADNFTVQFSNLLKLPLEWETKQLNGSGNYRELRETGPCRHDQLDAFPSRILLSGMHNESVDIQ